MGLQDLELWFGIVAAASSVLFGVWREKIRADRDKALAELALSLDPRMRSA
jgi:hypothetical protein